MTAKVALISIAILALLLALLPLLSPIAVFNRPGELYTQKIDQEIKTGSYVSSLGFFEKSGLSKYYELTYGFIDYNGGEKYINFSISKDYYKSAINQFGFELSQIYRQIGRELELEAERQLENYGYHKYVDFSFSSTGEISYSLSAPSDIYRNVVSAADSLIDYLSDKQSVLFDEKLYDYGFYIYNNTINIDFNTVISWNHPYLKDCFKALYNSGKGYSLQEYLGLFIAFLQEITYEIPPDTWKGKIIEGLWVPPEVLVNNHGDCDSKSVLFCALWKYFKNSPLIVIEVPGHILVGVGIAPAPGQEYTRIGNQYYVMCEVVGPGKFYPGYQESVKGSFIYYTIK
ncbi:hypothetical protein ES703_113522 [subsurface metagenome]